MAQADVQNTEAIDEYQPGCPGRTSARRSTATLRAAHGPHPTREPFMTPSPWREADPGKTETATPHDVIDSWMSRLDTVGALGLVSAELLEALARTTEARRGSLMMVNPHTGRLRIMAAVGLPDS